LQRARLPQHGHLQQLQAARAVAVVVAAVVVAPLPLRLLPPGAHDVRAPVVLWMCPYSSSWCCL